MLNFHSLVHFAPAFDAHGEHLLILDSAGTLHVLEAHGDHFDALGTVDVITGDDMAARIATSGGADLAFVTDAAGRSVVVDLEDLEVVDHIDLDFAPVSRGSWPDSPRLRPPSSPRPDRRGSGANAR